MRKKLKLTFAIIVNVHAAENSASEYKTRYFGDYLNVQNYYGHNSTKFIKTANGVR